jgi:hypothetical protein
LSWVVWNNMRELASLWTRYTLIFTKSYETFLSKTCPFLKWFYANLHNFWRGFGYYYHYFIIRWLVEVWILPICQLNFSSISWMWNTIDHISLNIFFGCFRILLEVHIGQFGIIFMLKILENPRWQLICCLLHEKKYFEGI